VKRVTRRAVFLAVIGLCVAALGGSAAARPGALAGMVVFDARPDQLGNYGWQIFSERSRLAESTAS
jgi:hypothetical protein